MVTLERQLEIRYLAIDIQERCKVNLRQPIAIESVICNCEYLIYHINCRLNGILGFTAYFEDMDKYLIVTDKHENGSQQRLKFTLAHEIGHIACGHLRSDCTNSIVQRNYDIEREASIFADELLMPTIQMVRYNLDSPQKLQKHFDVSFDAACNKFKYLDDNALYNDYKDSLDAYFYNVSYGKQRW